MKEHGERVCYADQAWHGKVQIEENARLARDTFRVRVRCPEVAGRIVPGQFVMLRLPETNDPLLGRPLAVYDTVPETDGTVVGLDLVYLAAGKMTKRLARMEAGCPLEIWGPLGNGFPPSATSHLVMVAGGIGQTPFLSLAQEYLGLRRYGNPGRKVPHAVKVTLCYGVRTAEYFAGLEDFRRLGVDLQLSTDDGSVGRQCLVTDLIRPAVSSSPLPSRIVCCGPEAMMKRTAEIACALGAPCQLSLESPMACGIGICFSCVAKVRDNSGGWDYRRTCVEGPVFEATEIEF